jgi:transcription elongation factor GreA
MAEPIEYLTKEKFAELTNELEEMKTKKRKEVAESLEYAKSLGDLSENAEYHEARELQASTEDRIAKLEEILKSATILSGHDTSTVGMGSSVTIDLEKNRRVFTIVSSEEVDIAGGKISMHSPLGEKLLGKKRGDEFSYVPVPEGKSFRVKVIDIK